MGKKGKTGRKSKNRAQVQSSPWALKWLPLVLVGVVALVLSGYLFYRSQASPVSELKSNKESATPYNRKETRPTLLPAMFVGKSARAYQVAQEIPDVLDQLYCYCYCDREHGHKTLLTCYTETHAAT